MMEGENPAASIKLFYEFKIFSHILKFHESCQELQNEEFVEELTYCSLKVCEILGILFKKIKKDGELMSIEWPSKDEIKEFQKYTFYSGILVPFKDYDYTIKKGQKSKTEKMINYVMFESLKQPNKGKAFANACLEYLDKAIELVTLFYLTSPIFIRSLTSSIILNCCNDEFDVLSVGTVLKELGEYYRPTLLLALSTEYFRDELSGKDSDVDIDKLNEYLLKYERFHLKVKRDQLENAHLLKPLMNGKDIMALYNIKGGPLLKKLTDIVFKWQIEHMDGTLEELKEYMELHKDEFMLL